jgi:TRAP-type C4-dicarboxylate transport system substrate-binding protein
MSLPVYSRADHSRTVALVVALSLTAASTGAVARELRAAETQLKDHRTVEAQHHMASLIAPGTRSIYIEIRPAGSLADISGLRIGVQQSGYIFRCLGAEPIELPYGQALTGLATKLTDGAENNWPSFVTTDHYNRRPSENAMDGIDAKAQRDAAVARLIERRRKVE